MKYFGCGLPAQGVEIAQCLIVAGQSSPYGLAVCGNHLFFASVQDETIYKANLNGTNPQPVVKQLSGLTAMAVAYGRVYWANAQGPFRKSTSTAPTCKLS